MLKVPTYVLLMYGNVYPWGVLGFNKFLREEVGIPNQRINLMRHWEEPERQIMEFLGSLPRSQKANLLVVCDAHGGPGDFSLNGRDISYQKFASYFDINGDLIFLNNTCFSGSCIEAFSEAGLLPSRSMVISSSQHDEASYRSRLLDELIKSYSKRLEYKPRQLGYLYRVTGQKKKIRVGKRAARYISADELKTEEYEDERQHPVKEGKSLDHLLFA